MNLDSFFSTFAQSVAAVVGVIAAFVIARLLDAQAEHARAGQWSDELEINGAKLRDAARSRDFGWFVEQALKETLGHVRSELNAGNLRTADEFYASLKFPPFLSRDKALRAIEETIREWRFDKSEAEARKAERREREAREWSTSSLSAFSPGRLEIPQIPYIKPMHEHITEATIQTAREREMKEEEDQINALVIEIKHHIRVVGLHLRSTEGNPQRSSLVNGVIFVLAFLYAVGIVYPLSFLPSTSVELSLGGLDAFFSILLSLRGVLLSLMSFGFCGLLVLLYRGNAQLTHPVEQIDRLKLTTEMSYYSDYLQTMSDNEARQASRRIEPATPQNPPPQLTAD